MRTVTLVLVLALVASIGPLVRRFQGKQPPQKLAATAKTMSSWGWQPLLAARSARAEVAGVPFPLQRTALLTMRQLLRVPMSLSASLRVTLETLWPGFVSWLGK
jgi:hypothetical protein